MKKNYIARRRGTSVAAAALSLALVAPAAQTVAVAQTSTTAVADQAAGAPVVDQNGVIDADMIASGRVTKAANLTDAHGVGKGLISGHVFLTGTNGNPGSTIDNWNIPLNGVTVYAQFRDKDGSYSPIFKAQTHTLPDVVGGNGGQGTYAFGTGDKGITWTDKLGVEHTWAARTDQQHRIWVEPSTNERGNRVEMFRQANGFVPGSFNGLVEYPLGSFAAADGNIQLTAAFLREIPPSHENSYLAAKGDKLVEDTEGPVASASTQLDTNNVISGRVWLETGHADGGIVATGPAMNPSNDVAADGYTVYASTLTKDGAAANATLHETYKDDPNKLAEETKKMLEDHPEYIAKTVYGKTDAEGRYSLRFGDYTDANQTREDILNPNHVFVWVENQDGVVQDGYTGFHTPVFQRFNAGGNFRPAAIPAENQTVTARVEDQGKPRYGKPVNSIYNMNYAVMPYAPATITADYNATDKPAAPGTTVTPAFDGTLSSLPSVVEWRDVSGKVLKSCEIDQSKAVKDQVAACTFDIPDDAKKGDYFNVVLVSGGNDVSAWTVLVTKDSDEFTPAYKDKLVVPGKETKSTPTFTKTVEDANGNPVEEKVDTPEGSKFAIPGDFKAPEGYEATIDENTGEITVTFPDESKLTADTIEEFDVPVTVTYPDRSTDDAKAKFELDTDGDGTPDSKDDDDDGDGIPDTEEKDNGTNPKVPNQNLDYQPEYEDGSGKPGEDVTVPAPTFKDKDGNDTPAPEGTKFTPGENAPEGVTVDPNTGEVTVKVPEGAKPGDKITVPVDVTYPDRTKDTVDVTVTVTEKDASPDWDDASTTSDKPVTIEKDPDSGEFTPGSTVEVTEGPGTAKIDDNGTITVTPNEDAKPGNKIVVEVKDPNGKVIDTVTVEIVENQAQQFIPNYEDLTKVEVDKTNDTNNPFGDQKAPLKNIDSKPSAGSQDWEFKPQDNGVITAIAPTMDEVGKAVGEQLPVIDKSWEKFVETFTPYARPSVIVDFTYQDDSKNTDTANFDLLGKDGKSMLDPDGDFDGDGYTNKEEIEDGSNPADPTSKPSEGQDVPEDTTPPTVNPIKPGDKTVSGTGDRPNEDIIVELPGGKKVETKTDNYGNWTIDVPADVDLQPGQNVTVSDGAGNKTNAKVGIDTGKCVATSVGFGLPLLALIPLGLATQIEIPGLSNLVGQANAQLQAVNTQIQQQLGVFNPEFAVQVEAINNQLAQFGTDLATVAGGLALIAAGILAGTIIYDNCTPGGGSSVQGLELKGSSGKTYTGSSTKDEKGAESGSSKKNNEADEAAPAKK